MGHNKKMLIREKRMSSTHQLTCPEDRCGPGLLPGLIPDPCPQPPTEFCASAEESEKLSLMLCRWHVPGFCRLFKDRLALVFSVSFKMILPKLGISALDTFTNRCLR